MRRQVLWLTIILGAAACGGKTDTGAGDTAPAAAARPGRRATNLVTADEIKAQGGTNLYEILRALRPTWFRTAPTRMTGGGVTADPVSLYLDGRRIGTASGLRDIPLVSVVTVRFYSASEAQGRFGMDNLQGAIEVITSTR